MTNIWLSERSARTKSRGGGFGDNWGGHSEAMVKVIGVNHKAESQA